MEENFDLERGVDYNFEKFEQVFEMLRVDIASGGYFVEVDGQKGLISAVFHFLFQEGKVFEFFPKLGNEGSDFFAFNGNEENAVDHQFEVGFYFFSEAGVLFVYDQAVLKVIELDFYFVFILQDSNLFCNRLCEEIKVGGIFYSCEVI